MTTQVSDFDVTQKTASGELVIIPIHQITSMGFRKQDHSTWVYAGFAMAMLALLGLFWIPVELALSIAFVGLVVAVVAWLAGKQELVLASPTATITVTGNAQQVIDTVRDRWALQTESLAITVPAP